MHRVSRRVAVLGGATALAGIGASSGSKQLFVLGDSWAAGLHADPAQALGQIASAQLGWRSVVDAVSGTGYVNGASGGTSYPDRLRSRRPDGSAAIAVIQGGSNDRAASTIAIAEAATRTLALVRHRLPGALPVVLGPGPDPLPVTSDQAAVDRVLREVARQQSVPYISMLQQHWITERTAAGVLDPDNDHPTVAGQRYLGLRLAACLRRLYPRLTR